VRPQAAAIGVEPPQFDPSLPDLPEITSMEQAPRRHRAAGSPGL